MPEDKTSRTTMNDVASMSGVSYQTVSRVINNHPRVAPATRARVLRVIEEIGYRPNKSAQRLASNNSRVFAVIATGIEHYGPAQMVASIEQAARMTDYDIIIRNVTSPDVEELQDAMEELRQWNVDAIIVIAAVVSTRYDDLSRLRIDIPVVEVDAKPNANAPSLSIDQYVGSQSATQHLIDLGHRHIAEIHGPLQWFGAMSRHKAYIETLAQAGLAPVACFEGDWSAQSGYQATKKMLPAHQFTGLVVGNDQMALGAIRAIHERGLHVPGDISVVGFDDIPEAAYFHPPLTTVHQNFADMGRVALHYTIQIAESVTPSTHPITITPELVVRESTALPRSLAW